MTGEFAFALARRRDRRRRNVRVVVRFAGDRGWKHGAVFGESRCARGKGKGGPGWRKLKLDEVSWGFRLRFVPNTSWKSLKEPSVASRGKYCRVSSAIGFVFLSLTILAIGCESVHCANEFER